MEAVKLEVETPSLGPRESALSHVDFADLPGTSGAGAEEARQILLGAFPTLVSLFMLYSRVGSECATLEEVSKLRLDGFRKLLKDAPSLKVLGMGVDAMAGLFARCLTGQPQPALTKPASPAAR